MKELWGTLLSVSFLELVVKLLPDILRVRYFRIWLIESIGFSIPVMKRFLLLLVILPIRVAKVDCR